MSTKLPYQRWVLEITVDETTYYQFIRIIKDEFCYKSKAIEMI